MDAQRYIWQHYKPNFYSFKSSFKSMQLLLLYNSFLQFMKSSDPMKTGSLDFTKISFIYKTVLNFGGVIRKLHFEDRAIPKKGVKYYKKR